MPHRLCDIVNIACFMHYPSCINVTLDSWWVFNTVIIIAILLNCVQLALAQYLPNGDRASNADFLDATEPYFLLIFVFEMVVKILAHGFALHAGSYLRDGWNMMDFVVVSTGLLEAYGQVKFDPCEILDHII